MTLEQNFAPLSSSFADSFTRAVHGDPARSRESNYGALCPPIAQSVTFARPGIGVAGGYSYSRVSNPTVDALESALGALENAPPAVCFDSGLSAETTLFLALLEQGTRIVLSDVVYGGTTRLLRQILGRFGVETVLVDCTDLAAVERSLDDRTRLFFVETPANPTLKLLDIDAVARIAKRKRVPLCVDNTFLTGVIQRPLDLGADLSLYSTTKYIEGHNGALGGAIVSRDEKLLERLRFLRKCLGTIQTPLSAYLTLRGIKTLPLRLERASSSALEVARALKRNRGVLHVNYPGLPDSPQHALATSQHGGIHGGVLSFEVAGGKERAQRVIENLRLLILAENLGATESLVTHSATMTHADVPADERARLGISDGLIRVSLGLEDPRDVIGDLEQALDAAERNASSRLVKEVCGA